ncbi:MAG: cupin domain-containing protein [Devosia sp.]
MTLISAASAPVHDFDGVIFTGLAAPSRGASENAVWRVKLPAGRMSDATHQLSREEILVAVQGSGVATIGEIRHDFSAGDTIVVPAFVDFKLDNPGDMPFEAIAILPVGGRAIMPGVAPFTPPWAA